MKYLNIFKRVILSLVIFLASTLPSWGQEMDMRGFEFFQYYFEQNYTKAIETGESILKDAKPIPILYYIYSEYMIDCYDRVGDKKKAEDLARDVELVCKDLDLDAIDNYLNQYMSFYTGTDANDVSIEIIKQQLLQSAELIENAQYNEAKKILEHVIEIYGNDKDLIYGTARGGLANCYQGLGEYHEAIKNYRVSLEIVKRELGENNETYARSVNNYGFCLAQIGDFKNSLEQLMMSLKINKVIHPADHPDIAMSLGNIGFCLQHQFPERHTAIWRSRRYRHISRRNKARCLPRMLRLMP